MLAQQIRKNTTKESYYALGYCTDVTFIPNEVAPKLYEQSAELAWSGDLRRKRRLAIKVGSHQAGECLDWSWLPSSAMHNACIIRFRGYKVTRRLKSGAIARPVRHSGTRHARNPRVASHEHAFGR